MNNPQNIQAFPFQKQQYGIDGSLHPQEYFPGLTLLDYFAGQALIGILSNPNLTNSLISSKEMNPDKRISEGCYTYAQAMLKERQNHV